MELLYLYVQRFGVVPALGAKEFTFSPQYQCDASEGAGGQFNVRVSEADTVPRDFFPAGIVNVSYLVGPNGSGKTILIELLRYVLTLKDQRTNMIGREVSESRFFALFKRANGELIGYSALEHGTGPDKANRRVLCTLGDAPVAVHDLLEWQGARTRYLGLSIPVHYPSIAVVSYAPVLNLRDYPVKFSDPGYVDVSSNFLAEADKKEEHLDDALLAHRRADVRRALNLLHHPDRRNWMTRGVFRDSDIPKKITVEPLMRFDRRPGERLRYTDLTSMRVYDRLAEHVLLIHNTWLPALREARTDELHQKLSAKLFRLYALGSFIQGLFEVVEHRDDRYKSPNDFLFKVVSAPVRIEDEEATEPLERFLLEQTVIPPRVIQRWLRRLHTLEQRTIAFEEDALQFEFDITHATDLLQLDSVLEHAREVTQEVRPLMTFDWADLSSGQKMRLDLFSRLLYAKSLVQGAEPKTPYSTLYLLLDEPDMGFHPEWQRTYLNDLLRFLPQLYVDQPVQVMVATNHPLSLSDLPGGCVEYLDPHGAEPHTFAANIHELLGDSFYLQDGFIGMFAKEKLESLIQFLSSEGQQASEQWNETSALQVITLVGDRLIRERLQDLFDDKYSKQSTVLDAQIAQAEERVRMLKRLRSR